MTASSSWTASSSSTASNAWAAADQPAAIRPGEELNAAALEIFLHAALPETAAEPLAIQQFPRGFSNLTYLLRLGERELVLRRPPFGANIKGAHDMQREYRLLSALRPVYPKVPRALAYSEDPAILGAPFYVMERVSGVILRNRPVEGLTPERMRAVCAALIDTLVELHAVDPAALALADWTRPQGYVARQVSGWIKRYQNARTDDVPEMEAVAAWLAEHQPSQETAALIHNDFKYDNLVLNPLDWTQVIAVLDWEMATIGDPLMDLGTTLGYWAEAGDAPELQIFGLTHHPGNLTRQEVVEQYARRSGRDLAHILFYYVYGCFKVAVIGQQIYARYRQGFTHDERFARLNLSVAAGARAAWRAIQTQRL